MKTALVYYSHSGNTGFIARAIAGSVGAESLELQPVKSIPSRGPFKYISGVSQVFGKAAPALEHYSFRWQDYDLIFIGTPVWACSMAAPMRTYLGSERIRGKSIALFCCHRGGRGGFFANMEKALAGNEIISRIDFVEPFATGKDRAWQKARGWADEVLKKARQRSA